MSPSARTEWDKAASRRVVPVEHLRLWSNRQGIVAERPRPQCASRIREARKNPAARQAKRRGHSFTGALCYIAAMSKEQVKEMLDRVLTRPPERQEDAGVD